MTQTTEPPEEIASMFGEVPGTTVSTAPEKLLTRDEIEQAMSWVQGQQERDIRGGTFERLCQMALAYLDSRASPQPGSEPAGMRSAESWLQDWDQQQIEHKLEIIHAIQADARRSVSDVGRQGSAEAWSERLADKLQLILPLAKGYASDHRVGNNGAYVAQAAELLEEYRATLYTSKPPFHEPPERPDAS